MAKAAKKILKKLKLNHNHKFGIDTERHLGRGDYEGIPGT